MSSGFQWYVYNPPKKQYLDTHANHEFQKTLEKKIRRELPLSLTQKDLPILFNIRNSYSRDKHYDYARKNIDELIEAINKLEPNQSIIFERDY